MSIFPKINTISALKEYSKSDLLVIIRKLNYQGGGQLGGAVGGGDYKPHRSQNAKNLQSYTKLIIFSRLPCQSSRI